MSFRGFYKHYTNSNPHAMQFAGIAHRLIKESMGVRPANSHTKRPLINSDVTSQSISN